MTACVDIGLLLCLPLILPIMAILAAVDSINARRVSA